MESIYLAMFYTGMFVAAGLFLALPVMVHIRNELRAMRRALERLELIKPD